MKTLTGVMSQESKHRVFGNLPGAYPNWNRAGRVAERIVEESAKFVVREFLPDDLEFA
jgi:hypothetical protein